MTSHYERNDEAFNSFDILIRLFYDSGRSILVEIRCLNEVMEDTLGSLLHLQDRTPDSMTSIPNHQHKGDWKRRERSHGPPYSTIDCLLPFSMQIPMVYQRLPTISDTVILSTHEGDEMTL